jgi:hypothetical protein
VERSEIVVKKIIGRIVKKKKIRKKNKIKKQIKLFDFENKDEIVSIIYQNVFVKKEF